MAKFLIKPATEGLKYTIDDTHSEFHEKVDAEINGARQHFDVGLAYDYVNIPGLIKGLTELQWAVDNLETLVKNEIPKSDRILLMFKEAERAGAAKKVASMGISVKYILFEAANEFTLRVGYEACNHMFSCIFKNRKLVEVDGSD